MAHLKPLQLSLLRNPQFFLLRIEIVGHLGLPHYTESSITALLQESGTVEMRHGDQYTGRPGTRLHAGAEDVVKFRIEYALPLRDARRLAEQALQRERTLAVHHPAKTWFLIHDESEKPLVCNITPRLTPLHKHPALLSETSGKNEFLDLICGAVTMHVKIAEAYDIALDISLSNFGIDSSANLYYIDDDSYSWDQFSSLTQFLGVLLRTIPWFDDAVARRLGTCVRESVIARFNDPLWTAVIAEELHGIYTASDREKLLRQLRDSIASAPMVRRHKVRKPVVALLADIHANAPALNAVLDYLDDHGVDEAIILGDVVGYGPHPERCIDLLAERDRFVTIQGNHDHAVCTSHFGLGFSAFGRWAVEWTADQLSDSHRDWLSRLPLHLAGDNWLAVHGAPSDKTFFNAYVYEMTYEDNLDTLAKRELRYCFHGHTHLQKTWYRAQARDGSSDLAKQQLDRFKHALICPGSVGQPRNGQPGAEFALLDMQTWELELMKIPYDLETTLADMNRYQFPQQLIDRLRNGK